MIHAVLNACFIILLWPEHDIQFLSNVYMGILLSWLSPIKSLQLVVILSVYLYIWVDFSSIFISLVENNPIVFLSSSSFASNIVDILLLSNIQVASSPTLLIASVTMSMSLFIVVIFLNIFVISTIVSDLSFFRVLFNLSISLD